MVSAGYFRLARETDDSSARDGDRRDINTVGTFDLVHDRVALEEILEGEVPERVDRGVLGEPHRDRDDLDGIVRVRLADDVPSTCFVFFRGGWAC